MAVWSPVAAAPGGLTETTAVFTANLAQAAATYDLCAATGGAVLVREVVVYVSVAGATFTSVAIQTNTTTAVTFLTAGEGAVANVTVDKTLKDSTSVAYLASGKKIQFTLVGATGTGTLLVTVRYTPLAAGATLA